MKNKIPTAEELIIKQYGEIYDRRGEIQKSKISRERYIELFGLGKIDNVEPGTKELMIKFAKLHVKAAIKACIEDAPSGSSTDTVSYEDVVEALKDSYPLTLIK